MPAAGADGSGNDRMGRGDVSQHGMCLTFDGQLFPGTQPPKDRFPRGDALHRPNPEDGADADEEGHEVAEQEGPQCGLFSGRQPSVQRTRDSHYKSYKCLKNLSKKTRDIRRRMQLLWENVDIERL